MSDPTPTPTPGTEAELLTGANAFADCAVRMIGAARTELTLLSQELDRRIYGSEAMTAALRAFILQNDRGRVRVLVNSTQVAVANSPRFVEFGRTLSTFIEFRELLPNRQMSIREEYLIADGRVLLYRETPQDLQAYYYGALPSMARLRMKEFDALWQESSTAQELRRLNL